MPVRIRLARRGRKNLPMYSIVVADARAKRDGRFIEKIGTYNPHRKPAPIQLKDDLAVKWLLQGAQATDTVRSLLSSQGIMLRKHLQQGVQKGAITQAVADQRLASWEAVHKNKKRPFRRVEPQIFSVKPTSDSKVEEATQKVASKSTLEGKGITSKKSTKSELGEGGSSGKK